MLVGGDGDDLLIVGQSHDQLVGGSGNDTVSYVGSSAAVTVNLLTGSASGGGDSGQFQFDQFSSIENLIGSSFGDTLTGDNGANRLDGAAGNDSLNGGNGNDILDGGTDSDTLTGGAGDDRLLFSDGYGSDVLTDFTIGDDTIDFTGIGTAADNFADVQSHASQVGAHTVVDFGNGDVLTIQNVLMTNLSASDFLF